MFNFYNVLSALKKYVSQIFELQHQLNNMKIDKVNSEDFLDDTSYASALHKLNILFK